MTKIILASMKVSSSIFVNIPGGYLPMNDLIPVNFENKFTACHPFSLLHTMIMSSGLYCDKKLHKSLNLSFICCTFSTNKPSGLALYMKGSMYFVFAFVPI